MFDDLPENRVAPLRGLVAQAIEHRHDLLVGPPQGDERFRPSLQTLRIGIELVVEPLGRFVLLDDLPVIGRIFPRAAALAVVCQVAP